jgi:N-acetylornithine carbamoyltransferase
MSFRKTRDLATLNDLGDDEVDRLLTSAAMFRAGRRESSLDGRTVGLLFLNPSLRTRSSLEAASARLGGHAVVLSPGQDAWKIEMRDGVVMDGDAAEHVREAAGVLCRHHAILGLRCFPGMDDWAVDREDPVLAAFRRHATVPIVNMESARWHPLQALADLLTMRDVLGDPKGAEVLLTWAYHPRPLPTAVPSSFLRAAARTGARVTLAHPPGFELPDDVVDAARADADDRGGEVRVTNDRRAAFDGAQVVYAKSWGSPAYCGRWGEEKPHRDAQRGWIVDEKTMARTDDAAFLHCLPVRRGVVVTDGVLDGPGSRVLDQAENRLWTALAVLHEIASGQP